VEVDLSVEEASVVFSHCDASGKGEMDYLSFLDLLEGKPVDKKAGSSVPSRPSASSSSSASAPASTFNVGDKVLGNFDGKGEWFPGKIVNRRQKKVGDKVVTLYDVLYDDGDSENGVPSDRVKSEVDASSGGSSTGAGSSKPRTLEELIPAIQHKLNREAGGRDASRGRIQAVFSDLDQDDSKTVNLKEFRRGLEVLGLDLRGVYIYMYTKVETADNREICRCSIFFLRPRTGIVQI
jgi:hypothetical protein